MSRTISQLSPGTIIYLDENGVHTPYWYLGLDENNICRIMREKVCRETYSMPNSIGYPGSPIDTWLSTTFLSKFDEATRNTFVETAISCAYQQSSDAEFELTTIPRKCFLPSRTELGYGPGLYGDEGIDYSEVMIEIRQLLGQDTYYYCGADMTPDNTSHIKESGSEYYYNRYEYWTRTISNNSSSTWSYYYIQDYGDMYSATANYSYYVRPCLAINPNATVSEEGAQIIFLSPEGRDATWKIDVEMSLGITSDRPKQGKIHISGDDGMVITNLQACNNYNDPKNSRIWVNAENNLFIFGETKIDRIWNIGLKFAVNLPTPTSKLYAPTMLVYYDT